MKKFSVGSLLLIYCALSLCTFVLWNMSNLYSVTGDEPHYLVIASGIGKHGSLEQTQPYGEEFLTRKIYKLGLAPQGAVPAPENTHAVKGPHGLFNAHNIGLPLLLALPFLLGGVLGAKLFMILCGASVVIATWKVSGIFSNSEKSRYWSTLVTCISIPLIPASAQIYPDILAGLISLSGLYWLLTTSRDRTKLTEFVWAGLIAFLPWLQIKFLATFVLLILAVAIKVFWESKDYKRALLICTTAFISCTTLAAYNYYAFGTISGPYQSGALEISKTSLMVFLGLCLDQNQGFLVLNPINLLGLVSIGGLYRYSKAFAFVWGLVFLSLIVPNAMHPNWYGGGSFSGRFGWSAAIVFMLPVAYGLLKLAGTGNRVFQITVGLAVLLQAYFFYLYALGKISLYNQPVTTWFENYSTYYFPFHRWLPMLYNSAWAYDYPPNYAWLFLAVSLVLAGFWSGSKLKAGVAYASILGFSSIFASGFLMKPGTNAAIFLGRDLPSQTGRIQDFNRVVVQGVDRPGFVSFGPYFPLRKGRYALTLKYRSSAATGQVIGKFDIFDSTSGVQNSELSLHGTTGHLQALDVAFETPSWDPHLYEFRNYWHGSHDLEILEIDLKSISDQ